MTYQAPITGLHSPTLLPLLQNSTDYLMLAQSWSLEWIAAPLVWLARGLHPSAWASDFWTCPQTPPLNPICSKRVLIDWACAEDSDDEIQKIRGSAPVKFWRGGPKNSDPPAPPLPPPIGPIHIPIESSRREDSKYIIFIGICKYASCTLLTRPTLCYAIQYVNVMIVWETGSFYSMVISGNRLHTA